MSVDIGPALSEGVAKLRTTAGLQLAAIYGLVALVTSVTSNSLTVSMLPTAREQVGLVLPLSPAALGLLLVVGLVANLLLTVVTLRAMARDPAELGAIPRGVTENLGLTAIYLFAANLLVGIAVVVGLVLLIIPGLFLLVSLFFTQVFVAVEGEGPLEAMSSSWSLVKGDRIVLFLLGILIVVIGALAGFVGTVVGFVSQPAGTLVSALVSGAVFVFTNGVLLAVYHQLQAGQAEQVGALGPDDLPEGGNQNG